MNNQAPISLDDLSLYTDVKVQYVDGELILILDIGQSVDVLSDAVCRGNSLFFNADGLNYSYNIPDEIYESSDFDMLVLKIQNEIEDELFNVIKGPYCTVEFED